MASSEPLTTSYVPQVDVDDAPKREEPRPSAPAPEVVHVNHLPAHEPVHINIQPDTKFVQYGEWKDGVCECCTKGGWPSLWMSCCMCCWPCLFGQVASRIRWSPGLPKALGKSPYSQWVLVMTVLLCIYIFCEVGKTNESAQALAIHIDVITRCEGKNDPYSPCSETREERAAIRRHNSSAEDWEIFSYLALFTMTVLLMLLRLRTRTKFHIPSSCEGGPGPMEARRVTLLGLCEDAWCACCCGCCALAQMSRHTYAAEQCAPCNDPGPAESLEPQMAGRATHVTQMNVIHQGGSNGMYGHNQTIVPVATSVVPIPDATLVGQGMPVPAPQV
uniref:Uncharacterized protein n=1 Tax=Hemiselmis andersenii TaxID=464988 RepID=A0A6T8GWZ5_HEMAN|mmetsp:Transcript_27353/g.63540  ORF Transcript_27353/g.63540 Transcript_27353/m.63540 type:complete len:332 (+) Transcript_27353:65-1060(+)